MDGDDDNKRKRATPQDAPDVSSESSDASSSNTDSDDHESAPTGQKPKLGLSGKSKSFSNTRTKEIAKEEHKVNKKLRIEIEEERRQTEEALRRLEAAVSRVSAARIGSAEVARVAGLLDQPMAGGNQEEEADGDKKATEEEEEAQSDHSMTGAVSSDDKAKDGMVHDSNTDDENGGQNY